MKTFYDAFATVLVTVTFAVAAFSTAVVVFVGGA